VGNYSQRIVTVLLGHGSGGFSAPTAVLLAGGSPVSVAVADFNLDGKLDIVAVDILDNQISILLGTGDGRFRSAVQYDAGAGPFSVTVADLNGDNKPDLLVLNATPKNLGILMGNGDGTFKPAVFVSAGAPENGWQPGEQIAVGDFDVDGKMDVAVVNFAVTISALSGKGDGTFPGAATDIAAGASPAGVSVADFNSDGILDFATANQGADSLSVFLQDSSGNFAGFASYAVGRTPSAIAAGDINRDGKVDLITANQGDNTISLLVGVGDGTFQPAVSFNVGAQPVALAIADLNRDGKPDVISVNRSEGQLQGTVTILLSKGDGTFFPAVQRLVGAGPIAIAVADLNGDGNLDLAVANSLNLNLSILLGRGDGSFQLPQPTAEGTGGTSVVAVDMNNDLRADLVVGNYDKVKVLLNNGDGTFQPVALYPADFVPNYIAAADFNNDGRPDIFVAGGGNTGALVLNNGDGTLRTPIIYGVGSNPSGVALADFNGDGIVDALVVNKSSNSLTLLLNAMGTTLSLSSSHVPSVFQQDVQITATLRSVAGGAIAPTGTVTIRDGGVQLSSQDVTNTGVISLTTTNFAVGSHNLIARYSGDSNFIVRNSAALNQVVNRAPLDLSLQSSPNPVIAGNLVFFNAQLTPQFGGQPTGCISFKDGASSLGCQPINSLQASISTSALGFGQRFILADYAGDGNFLPATSPSLPEDVISQIVLSTDSVNFPVNVVGRNSRTASVTVNQSRKRSHIH
jgi:hypothetical protein